MNAIRTYIANALERLSNWIRPDLGGGKGEE